MRLSLIIGLSEIWMLPNGFGATTTVINYQTNIQIIIVLAGKLKIRTCKCIWIDVAV